MSIEATATVTPTAPVAPTEGAAPTETKAPEADGLSFASRMNALARREKHILEMQRNAKREVEEMKQKLAGYSKWDSISDRLKENPLDVLEKELGVSYNELSERLITGGENMTNREIQELRKELAELKGGISKEKEQNQAQLATNTEKALVHSIESHISNNKDFELMSNKTLDGVETAKQLIIDYYEKTGKILSTQEACSMVEQYLEETVKSIAEANKVRAMMGLQKSEQEAAAQQVTSPTEGNTGPRTLSNSMSPKTTSLADPRLDTNESLKQAAALLRWQK